MPRGSAVAAARMVERPQLSGRHAAHASAEDEELPGDRVVRSGVDVAMDGDSRRAVHGEEGPGAARERPVIERELPDVLKVRKDAIVSGKHDQSPAPRIEHLVE